MFYKQMNKVIGNIGKFTKTKLKGKQKRRIGRWSQIRDEEILEK